MPQRMTMTREACLAVRPARPVGETSQGQLPRQRLGPRQHRADEQVAVLLALVVIHRSHSHGPEAVLGTAKQGDQR